MSDGRSGREPSSDDGDAGTTEPAQEILAQKRMRHAMRLLYPSVEEVWRRRRSREHARTIAAAIDRLRVAQEQGKPIDAAALEQVRAVIAAGANPEHEPGEVGDAHSVGVRLQCAEAAVVQPEATAQTLRGTIRQKTVEEHRQRLRAQLREDYVLYVDHVFEQNPVPDEPAVSDRTARRWLENEDRLLGKTEPLRGAATVLEVAVRLKDLVEADQKKEGHNSKRRAPARRSVNR